MSWQKFLDINKDGIITLMDATEGLRRFLYVLVPCYMVRIEALHPAKDIFSEWDLGLAFAASFGAATFEIFIKSKYGGERDVQIRNEEPGEIGNMPSRSTIDS